MYNLLKINNVTFPKPASFDISLEDKTNEFEAENGTRTIEVIREGIVKISVGYDALTDTKLQTCKAAITKISQVTFFNPYTGALTTKSMEVKNISTPKQYHDNNISTWGFSFALEEL